MSTPTVPRASRSAPSPCSGRWPRRGALLALAASGLLVLSGCGMIPWLVRTPEPTSSAPTSLSPEQLEHEAQACGQTAWEPEGDLSFTGTAERAESATAPAASVVVTVRVELDSAHGRHEADLPWTRGAVTDQEGRVVALVTGVEPIELGRPRDGAQSGTLEIALGACPREGAALGGPPPDGDLELVLHGPIRSLDHDHDQQERWLAAPLPLHVEDGRIDS